MRPNTAYDSFTPREIALAAGVPEADVLAALGLPRGRRSNLQVSHAEAVRLGRMLAPRAANLSGPRRAEQQGLPKPLFSLFSDGARSRRQAGVPLAVSSTLHAGLIAVAVFVATFNLSPRAATLRNDDHSADPMRLIFLATPGPGGGGGGGGLQQTAPPPKATRQGRSAISSPLPVRREPEPTPLEPKPVPPPPLKAETLPTVVAPIITAPADPRDRVGVHKQTTVEADSQGPGKGGGVGSGSGTGIGEGAGSGIGPGSGGGTGGGPYRAGSGIEPPRLLREVRADYTEDARQHGLAGDVVLEIVVRTDGSVGDVKILQGLGRGLNDRAVQAVREWRFAPARRQGVPVDVIVEVAVEFKLR